MATYGENLTRVKKTGRSIDWDKIGRTRATEAILADIATEREAQDARFGQQNHEDGTSEAEWGVRRDWQRARVDALPCTDNVNGAEHPLTWLEILLEEAYEVAAEEDADKLQVELNQLAAVCVSWREAILRRKRAGSP